MHAFLFTSVLLLAFGVAVLLYYVKRNDARNDDAFEEMWTDFSRIETRLKEVEQANQAGSALVARLKDNHGDLVRQVGIMNGESAGRLMEISEAVSSIDAKLLDLSARHAITDADLSQLALDLKELADLCSGQAQDVSARISEIAGEQEQARRRAARPGAPNSAFSAVRNVAEKNSSASDADHRKLVAAAEG